MINEYTKNCIREALQKTSPVGDVDFGVEHPRDREHGDFSTNIAMILAKQLKKAPFDIAKGLVPEIQAADSKKYFSEVVAVKPGFINIKLSPIFLSENLASILRDKEDFGKSDQGKNKKIVLEYSGLNTNKPMHIGHFRNDVTGMAVRNILEALGYKVILTTIWNDRGRHICKGLLMYQKYGDNQTPEDAKMKPDHFVGKFYAMYWQEEQKNPELEEEVSEMLRQWEAGDVEIHELWKKMNAWQYAGAQETFQREGSVFDDEQRESDMYKKGKDIVEKYVAEGKLTKKPDGSVVADLTKYGLDEKIVLRSDGTSVYITQDIYLGEYRENKYHPDRLLYCVDVRQAYHFKALFAIYDLIGYAFAKKSHHLGYGFVSLKEGQMSSREGNVVTTDDFLDEMHDRAKQVMSESKVRVDKANEDEIAEQIALGAAKYGMLNYELKHNIVFEPDKTIRFTGHTGPYLQYTYARIQGIMRKSDHDFHKDFDIGQLAPEEESLLRQLYLLPEIIAAAARTYEPHLLTSYLYELAQAYNSFYNNVPVLKAKSESERNFRLGLSSATAQVLKNGLRLLGIATPERM
ncbi:arginine--tRNA ligase [Patescibacteria group bacterium]